MLPGKPLSDCSTATHQSVFKNPDKIPRKLGKMIKSLYRDAVTLSRVQRFSPCLGGGGSLCNILEKCEIFEADFFIIFINFNSLV